MNFGKNLKTRLVRKDCDSHMNALNLNEPLNVRPKPSKFPQITYFAGHSKTKSNKPSQTKIEGQPFMTI